MDRMSLEASSGRYAGLSKKPANYGFPNPSPNESSNIHEDSVQRRLVTFSLVSSGERNGGGAPRQGTRQSPIRATNKNSNTYNMSGYDSPADSLPASPLPASSRNAAHSNDHRRENRRDDRGNDAVNRRRENSRGRRRDAEDTDDDDDDEAGGRDSVIPTESAHMCDLADTTASTAVRLRGHTCKSLGNTPAQSDTTRISFQTTPASTDISSDKDNVPREHGWPMRVFSDADDMHNKLTGNNRTRKNPNSSQLSRNASLQALAEGNRTDTYEITNTSVKTVPERGRLYGFKICKGRFEAIARIGSGSFGVIYSGIDKQTGNEVAIKFEPIRTQHHQAMFENRIYNLLHSDKYKKFRPTITRYLPPRDSPGTENDELTISSASAHDRGFNDSFGAAAPSHDNTHTAYSEGNKRSSYATLSNQSHAVSTTRSNGHVSRRGNSDYRSGGGNVNGKNALDKSRKSGERGQSHGVMMEFMRLQNVIGFARSYFYGPEGEYNALVMDFLGPNLEDLFRYCSRHFSLKTVCLLADQMLHRLEFLHHIGFIHRDLKPENFVMGSEKGKAHVLYLIDFGLAKRFWDARLNQHVPYKEGVPLTGTARYCSINAHLGTQQSRRDDLESLGYIILYFLKNGVLPWQGLRGFTDAHAKNVRISEKKLNTSLEVLCKDEPHQVYRYMKYVRDLKFDEVPDYRLCREFFAQILERHGYKRDWVFDWVVHRQKERSTENLN